MAYLLDTNAWITYLKRGSDPLIARIQATPADEVRTCSVVWAELLHGARKYGRRDARVKRIHEALAGYESIPFDVLAAESYAAIRDDSETRGLVLGPYDLLIAAIARSRGCVLVSHDRAFQRVDGLVVEDWSEP